MGIAIVSLAALVLLAEVGIYLVLSSRDTDDVSW